jgi:hypothetical protein
MPISVDCPKCSKTYTVKDEFAGRKFRCKECGAGVSVPDAAGGGDDDPWGDDLDDAGGDALPPKRSSAGKKKKKSRGGGMPATVIVAIVCESILILLNLVGVAGNLMSENVPGACGSLFHVMIEAAAIFGYIQRQNAARWTSVILCGISILGFIVCAGFLLVAGPNMPPEIQAQVPQELILIIVGVIVAQIFIFITILSCLLTGSAKDYFER